LSTNIIKELSTISSIFVQKRPWPGHIHTHGYIYERWFIELDIVATFDFGTIDFGGPEYQFVLGRSVVEPERHRWADLVVDPIWRPDLQ
jgi:hypothetical protein